VLNKNLSQFQRRFLALFSASILLTALITMFTHDYFRHQHHSTSGLLAWILALLPSLPFLGTIILALRYISRERDEFIRAQVLFALLQGSFVTLAFTVVYAFFENYLKIPGAPAMTYVDVFLVASMIALRIHLRIGQ
jgi:hypothetical protein